MPLDTALLAELTAAGARRVRMACLEMVHGSAGSTQIGIQKNLWAPAEVGRNFNLTGTSLASLVREGRLWGLIACHHYAPRCPSFERRSVAELFAPIRPPAFTPGAPPACRNASCTALAARCCST